MVSRESALEVLYDTHCPALTNILERLCTHVRPARFNSLFHLSYDKDFIRQLAAEYLQWCDEAQRSLCDLYHDKNFAKGEISPALQDIAHRHLYDLRAEQGFVKLFTGEMIARAMNETAQLRAPNAERGSNRHRELLRQIGEYYRILCKEALDVTHQAGRHVDDVLAPRSSKPNSQRGR